MKYKAFISYSQSEYKYIASKVQQSLETFAKKFYQTRSIRIFRDETNFEATYDLWGALVPYLQEAEFLIYLASPEACDSEWVNRELTWWMKNKNIENILIILVGGQIRWDNKKQSFDLEASDSIPESISENYKGEPFIVDLTHYKNKTDLIDISTLQMELAPIAARIHKKDKDILIGEHAKRLKTKRNLIRLAFGAVTIVAISISGLTYNLYLAEKKASYNLSMSMNRQALFSLQEKNYNNTLAYSAEALSHNLTPGSVGYIDALSKLASYEKYTSRLKHLIITDYAIGGLAFSPSGQEYAFSGMGEGSQHQTGLNYNIHINSAETHKLNKQLIGFFGRIWKIQYVPNTEKLVASYADGKIRIWDTKNIKILKTFDVFETNPQVIGIFNFDISFDGKRIAYGDRNGNVYIRDLRNYTIIQKLEDSYKNNVLDITFSPGSYNFATSSVKGDIKLWHPNEGSYKVKKIHSSNGNKFSALAFTRDGNNLILTSRNSNKVQVLNFKTKQIYFLDEHSGSINSIASHPISEHVIVSVSGDKTIKLWDLRRKTLLAEILAHDYDILSVAFSPDGNNLVSGGANKKLHFWDITGLNDLAAAYETSDTAMTIGYQNNQLIKIWSTPDGKIYYENNGKKATFSIEKKVFDLDLSPNGKFFAAKFSDNSIKIFSTETGSLIHKTGFTGSRHRNFAFSNDNVEFVWGDSDGNINALRIKSGEIQTYFLPTQKATSYSQSNLRALAYSNDLKYFAYADGEGNIHLLDKYKNRILTLPQAEDRRFEITSVMFTEDAQSIMASTISGKIILWKKPTSLALEVEQFVDTTFRSPALKVIPIDGYHFASAHYDGRVRIWDTNTGNVLLRIDSAPFFDNNQILNRFINIRVIHPGKKLFIYNRGATLLVDLPEIIQKWMKRSPSEWKNLALNTSFGLTADTLPTSGALTPMTTPCPPFCVIQNSKY